MSFTYLLLGSNSHYKTQPANKWQIDVWVNRAN